MKIRHLIILAAALVSALPASSQIAPDPEAPADMIPQAKPAAVPALGREVLAFCSHHLGVKVGNGQCTTLAVQALAAAGARWTVRSYPNCGDYVWGRQVAMVEASQKGVTGLNSLAYVKRGDIIQFRDVRLEGVIRNGGGGTYWMSASHHTAVVAALDPDNLTLLVYHQNWGKMIVKKDTMYLADLRSGRLKIYRPTAAK